MFFFSCCKLKEDEQEKIFNETKKIVPSVRSIKGVGKDTVASRDVAADVLALCRNMLSVMLH